MLEQSYYEKTDEIIELHGATASSLIPVMQDVQAEYRYLPGELLSYIADKLGIPLAKAYSVATFYENFSFDPKGKYVIKVCDGTACHVRKSVPVREALEKEGIKMAEAEVTMIPQNYVELSDEDAIKKMNIIIDRLDEDEDVQQVYHNWDE